MEDTLERCSQLDACYQLEGKTNIHFQRCKYIGITFVQYNVRGISLFLLLLSTVLLRPPVVVATNEEDSCFIFSTRYSLHQFIEGTFISPTIAKETRIAGVRAF